MLKTVKVPQEFEPIFLKAQEYVSKYFKKRKEDAHKGTIEIFGQRYIFVRAASMSVEFFEMIKNTYKDKSEEEALSIARSLLFDIAHTIGVADARNFAQKMKLEDPISKLSAGPILFSHSGWAFVDIFPESRPTPDENYYLIYDHPYSFESDAWMKAKKKVDFPVCVMNSGYSSGWCEESFGIKLVASEIYCKAKGDEHCRFIMGHPAKIEGYIQDYLKKQPKHGKKIVRYEIPGFFSRKKAEDELKKTLEELESRVARRTEELSGANTLLKEQISERILTEHALKQSEQQYRALVEQSVNPVYILQDNHVVLVNAEWEKLFGYSRQEAFSPTFDYLTIIAPESLPLVHDRMDKRMHGDWVPPRYEMRAVTKDGRSLDLEVSTALIEWHDRPAIQGVYYDITERKKAEQALAAEKERLSVTLHSIGDGVITTDMNGNIILINEVAEKLTGWGHQEAQGLAIEEIFNIINQKTREKRKNPVRVIIQTGGVFELEHHTVLVARDGSERVISDSGAPIRDNEGNVIGVVLVFRDITEKQKVEEERVKVLKLESVGLLAGGIAHDFNNILTAILGNLSLAKLETENLNKDKIIDILGKSEKACMRAKELTQQLLTFSRGGAPVRTTASIVELVRDSSDFMVRGSNVRCEYAIARDLWPVEVDQGQISQVINNLILNSVQAMPEGGVIKVQAKNINISDERPLLAKGNYILLSVTDEGIGIPAEHLQKIFDPYFTTKQKGSGLGLATCYSIIKNHDGEITVESELGAGTTFRVYLPVSEYSLPSKPVDHEETSPGKGKILVMDDEEDIRMITCRLLSTFGYEFLSAADGEEALRLYREAKQSDQPVTAVIMDLTIPGGMGGKEAIKKLLEFDPNAKVVVSSGYSNDPIVANFKQFGFSGFLVKPFEMEELRLLLHDLTSGKN